MKCPDCKTDLGCPCRMCRAKNPGSTFEWVDGNGPLKCSVCGRIISLGEANQIEDNEFEEWKKNNGILPEK